MFRLLTDFLKTIFLDWLSLLPSMLLTLLIPACFCCTAPFCVPACFLKPAPLFLLPAFQSELRHGPFYYMKQPALTTDPVDVVPQDGRNDFYCWLCHREGQVLCCELCPRVYHAKCLKLPAEPEGDWFCPECEVSCCSHVHLCGCTQVIVELCAMNSRNYLSNSWLMLLWAQETTLED